VTCSYSTPVIAEPNRRGPYEQGSLSPTDARVEVRIDAAQEQSLALVLDPGGIRGRCEDPCDDDRLPREEAVLSLPLGASNGERAVAADLRLARSVSALPRSCSDTGGSSWVLQAERGL